MTVQTTTRRNDYTGNGAVDTYDYTFHISDQSHLRVTVRDTDDVETELTIATHYTVSGVGDTDGGSVALVNGAFDWIDGDGDLETGYHLTIRGIQPIKQETDIRNQGAFFAETHEDQFDNCIKIDQQQQEEIDRAVKLPETSELSDVQLPTPEAGSYLRWNSSEDGLENGSPSVTSGVFPGSFTAGVDASKAASPSTNDIYVATDTKICYFCFSAGTWTAFSITTGTAAARPASPKLGQVYLATDTSVMSACFVAGAWVSIGADGALFTNLANIPSGAGRIPAANMALAPTVTVLSDGANIATNAALGNHFQVTLAGNRTLDNPTNPTNGQRAVWEFIQDGTGSRTITLGSDFIFGTDVTSVTLTTTASKKDLMAAIYTGSKWKVVGFVRGYA